MIKARVAAIFADLSSFVRSPRASHSVSTSAGLTLLQEASRIFIAYSHSDLAIARAFRRRLVGLRRKHLPESVFLDQDALVPSRPTSQAIIDEAIDSCTLFVILCGADTADRIQVNREVERALALSGIKSLPLLPVLLRPGVRLPERVTDVQGVFYVALFPSIRRLRYVVVSSIAILVTASVGFATMWISGFDLQKYAHYRVLRATSDHRGATLRNATSTKRNAYMHVWFQRFAGGVVILPTQEESFTFHEGDQTFSSSLFVMIFAGEGGGRWFLQRRPPIEGALFTLQEFDALILGNTVTGERIREGLFPGSPASDGLSHQDLLSLYMPHAETSPINICGGIALAYVTLRLDRYLGRPLEHTFDGDMLLRESDDGYELSLLPAARAEPVAPGLLSRRSVATFLLRRFTPPEVLNLDEHQVAGGVAIYERGVWSEVDDGSTLAELLRPDGSFQRDLVYSERLRVN